MRFQQSYDLNPKWIILFKKYLKFAKASKRDQNISWPKTSCSRQLSWFVLVYICSLYHSLAWGLWLYWVLQNIYLTNDDTELLLWNQHRDIFYKIIKRVIRGDISFFKSQGRIMDILGFFFNVWNSSVLISFCSNFKTYHNIS